MIGNDRSSSLDDDCSVESERPGSAHAQRRGKRERASEQSARSPGVQYCCGCHLVRGPWCHAQTQVESPIFNDLFFTVRCCWSIIVQRADLMREISRLVQNEYSLSLPPRFIPFSSSTWISQGGLIRGIYPSPSPPSSRAFPLLLYRISSELPHHYMVEA